jgi:hypothetical protein
MEHSPFVCGERRRAAAARYYEQQAGGADQRGPEPGHQQSRPGAERADDDAG